MHQLTVSASGYDTVSQFFDVTGEEPLKLQLNLPQIMIFPGLLIRRRAQQLPFRLRMEPKYMRTTCIRAMHRLPTRRLQEHMSLLSGSPVM